MGPDPLPSHPCPSIGAWAEPPPLLGPQGGREQRPGQRARAEGAGGGGRRR